MPRQTRLVEIDLRSGIITAESPLAIGPRLRKATNAVWGYRYPRVGIASAIGPYFLRMPLTFRYKTATGFTNSGSRWYDIGFTQNNLTANQMLAIGAGTGSPNQNYEVYPLSGGTKLSYHASTSAFAIAASSVPGCSVYWDTPGTHPRGGTTTGDIDLDYNAAGKTITRASGSFLTQGFAPGDRVTVTESTSNNGTYTVSIVTASIITVLETLVDETSATSILTIETNLAAGVGAFIYSHPNGSNIYYLLDTDTEIRSLEAVTNCPTEGADALAVHLDRLWIGTVAPAYLGSNISQIWYTDPLDLRSIRTTNVVQVRGAVTKLIPGQFGTIDASGVPHLIIGTDTAVHVYDGDPSLGNAALRTLTMGHGIAGNLAAVNTPWGVYYLGTDHELHWIPLGCAETIPVGGPILDKIGVNPFTGVADVVQEIALSSLIWMEPYLYIWPGGNICEGYIAIPGRDGVQAFWGPVVPDATWANNLPAIVRQPAYASGRYAPSNKSGRHSVHAIQQVPASTSAFVSAFDEGTLETGNYPDGGNVGRTASIQTGLIGIPGHRAQGMRVILETVRVPQISAVDVQWTVQVESETGILVTCTRLPDPIPLAGSYVPGRVETQHYAVPMVNPSRGVAARAVSLIISCTATANLGLQRVLLEVHASPIQF